MKKILLTIVSILALSLTPLQACHPMKETSKPLPPFVIRDVQTGEEQKLVATDKNAVNLIVFGNLSHSSFVADLKALNAMDQKNLQHTVVIMDTKDIETIKTFIAENKILLRVVVPAQADWQKSWPNVLSRSVFISNNQEIVAQGLDVIGNEELIKNLTAKFAGKSS